MSRRTTIVKNVNTTYCAFLLGQSQDVAACASLCNYRQLGGLAAVLIRLGMLTILRGFLPRALAPGDLVLGHSERLRSEVLKSLVRTPLIFNT